MSPEYAFDGKFSVKSDIFSFGVLLLEIVSGKRNRGFCHPSHQHNLLGHVREKNPEHRLFSLPYLPLFTCNAKPAMQFFQAWLLWSANRATELIDGCLYDLVEPQVQRCIHIGLLCVQKFANDRPAMSSIVAMLGNESASLPRPKQPGFFMERSSMDSSAISTHEELHSINAVSMTTLDGR